MICREVSFCAILKYITLHAFTQMGVHQILKQGYIKIIFNFNIASGINLMYV